MTATQEFSLSGKVALVTGSSQGIGKAIAAGFAAAGARVYIHGPSPAGESVAGEIGGHFVQADFTDPAQVARLAGTVTAAEARLDVLVNNAGIDSPAPLEELTPDILDRVLQVNLRAPVELTRLLLPLLRGSSGASVINVTSIHEAMPYPRNAAYCMAKAALAMFSKAVTLELAPHGIRVNNLAPGAVETDINRAILDRIGRDTFAEWIPLGRVGQTSDMVGPALFLASDASRYVTGTTLVADGGYLQHLVREG